MSQYIQVTGNKIPDSQQRALGDKLGASFRVNRQWTLGDKFGASSNEPIDKRP